jgi:hypothetical protein
MSLRNNVPTSLRKTNKYYHSHSWGTLHLTRVKWWRSRIHPSIRMLIHWISKPISACKHQKEQIWKFKIHHFQIISVISSLSFWGEESPFREGVPYCMTRSIIIGSRLMTDSAPQTPNDFHGWTCTRPIRYYATQKQQRTEDHLTVLFHLSLFICNQLVLHCLIHQLLARFQFSIDLNHEI